MNTAILTIIGGIVGGIAVWYFNSKLIEWYQVIVNYFTKIKTQSNANQAQSDQQNLNQQADNLKNAESKNPISS